MTTSDHDRIKALSLEISRLKKERNAVLLVHNYQLPEVQDVADFLGDSLDLCMKAKSVEEEIIIFCGVDFMAESAKILNPSKRVFMPDPSAGCPMAHMVTADGLKKLKARHSDAAVVSYVNTTAETKALSDVCCTSANAPLICRAIPEKKIIFTPDRNLGRWTAEQVPEKEFILWEGYCPTHQLRVKLEDLLELKRRHPDALVMAHPECLMEILGHADAVLSTGGMLRYAKESNAGRFIVATEIGMVYRLQKENPKKEFIAMEGAVCPNMKKTTLEKVARCLRKMPEENEIALGEELMDAARKPLERMLEISRFAKK
ncbi:MAG: quinolinate synthase [Thermoplasmata archaeon HGW-Thermoplasmata-1]|nr:MAG: quinolinate synthase [Thermoplasmata archaeon HGW-Thermoplasmata-1]